MTFSVASIVRQGTIWKAAAIALVPYVSVGHWRMNEVQATFAIEEMLMFDCLQENR